MKTVFGPSKSIQDFVNAVNGYETTLGVSTRRDNRTTFSTVLNTAVKSELIRPHDLYMQFDISRRQVELARQNKSADVPKETRDALIVHLKAKVADLTV